MKLFVLVSTGQRVANLPPVLEHAAPGDHVLWVESDEARRKGWTAGPRAVLEERGLMTLPPVEAPGLNDPADLAERVRPFAERAAGGGYEAVFLVANGGTKLSPVGLLNGFTPVALRVLYGDDRPAVHTIYPAGFAGRPMTASYVRHDLDLRDILRVNGYTFASDSRHVRFWPDTLPVDAADEPYGADEAYAYRLHHDHFVRAAAPVADRRVPFAAIPAVAGDAFARWQRAMSQAVDYPSPATFEAVYHGTLNLDETARRRAGGVALPAPAARLGDAVERAVAGRVRAWLAATRHPAVRAAWAGVSAARTATPHQREVEYDVVLVLANGVLVHLECKSAAVDVRDLDARLHRLRKTTSQLAQLAVVLPLYTRRADSPWFAALHAARGDVRDAGLDVLPLTWPGQPETYPDPRSPADEVKCPPFEAALTTLLAPYHP